MLYELNPAVRNPEGQCIEEMDCDWEKVTLCAFDAGNDVSKSVDFLECMDKSSASKAESAAESCAPKANIEYSEISKCFSSDKGHQLLEKASKVWNAKFPQRATVPHIFVNDVNVEAQYNDIKTALCKDGSESATCSKFCMI